MSERVRNRSNGASVDWQSMTKSERRAAAKAAAAKAAAAKQRRQAIIGALAGLAVVGVIIGAFVVFRDSGDADKTGGTPAAAATPAASATAAAPPAAFPPLPAGADPALGKKPATTAGKGALTKLTVTPLVQGTGAAAKAGQNITVNYVGVSYQTGAEFDSSWSRSEPLSFPLGQGNVIQGWDQGLVGVKVGSRVQLDIPSQLAYGDNTSGGQPSGPLRFVVDMLAVQ
jgi:peptidylprolyl isomerase